MSFNGPVVKPAVVHPCHGILLSNKKEQTTETGNNLGESEGNYAEWKTQPVSPYILWVSICIMVQAFSNHPETQDLLWGSLIVEPPEDEKAAGSMQPVINKWMKSMWRAVVLSSVCTGPPSEKGTHTFSSLQVTKWRLSWTHVSSSSRGKAPRWAKSETFLLFGTLYGRKVFRSALIHGLWRLPAGTLLILLGLWEACAGLWEEGQNARTRAGLQSSEAGLPPRKLSVPLASSSFPYGK